MTSMKTLATTPHSASAPVHLSPATRYVLTGIAGFVGAVLLLGGLWALLRCCRRGQKGARTNEQWIPFRSTSALSSRPSVRRVQPINGASVWTDVKTKMLPQPALHAPLMSSAAHLSPTPVVTSAAHLSPTPLVTSGRRQSVPVLPSVYAAHALSAMDFTKRRYSVVSDQDGTASETEAPAAAAAAVAAAAAATADSGRRVSVTSKPRRRSSTCPPPGEVDRHMYGFGPEAALNAHGLGKLCFSLSYNAELEVLYVKIHRATYLSVTTRAKEYGDFHVEVMLGPPDSETEPKAQKTSVVRCIRNPIFEQEFSFNAIPEDFNSSVLTFTIKERRQTESVGTVIFALQELDLARDENANVQCIWRDIARHEKDSENGGQVYLSLSYNPQTSRLCVGVVKCRNLNVTSQETGVFCRLTVMSAEKVLKDDRGRNLKRDLRSPLVEQQFRFHIDKSLMNSICLAVTVWGKRSLGFNTLLGKCVLGPVAYSDGEGLLHWSTMMHEPQKTVHQWHSLK